MISIILQKSEQSIIYHYEIILRKVEYDEIVTTRKGATNAITMYIIFGIIADQNYCNGC